MAIVSVKQTHVNRSADIDAKQGRIVRAFIVQTDSVLDGSLVVSSAAGIPQRGSVYNAGGSESSNYWVVSRVTPRQRSESLFVWDVEVEYVPRVSSSSDGPPTSETESIFDVTLRAWRTIQESAEMPVDAYGLKAQTTAGEPFEDAPEADKSYQELTITRNESSFSSARMAAYVNSLNSEPAGEYVANEGRIISIDGSQKFDQDEGTYYEVTYVIQFKLTSVWAPTIDSTKILPDGTYPTGISKVSTIGPWDIVRRNAGTMAKKTSDAVVADPIVGDSTGHQFAGLYDIQPNGMQRKESLGDPYYLVFRPYLPKSWAALNLGI